MSDAPIDDESLLVAAAAGDALAFTALVESTLDEVRCCVALRASDADMADEAVQSTYVDAYRNLAAYRPGGSVVAWLKGIARHRVLRAQRERRRHHQLKPADWEALVEDRPEPAETTDQDLLKHLDACLAGLTPAVAELVARYYREGLPLTELAAATGRSRSGLAVTLCRARAALRDCLMRKGALR